MKVKWILENLKAKKYNEPAPEAPTDYGYYYKEFGDGWNDLIIKLCEEILKIPFCDCIEVVQIKSKFGGLRFYYDISFESLPEDTINDKIANKVYEKINKLISEAEEKSYKTCEVCGNPGKVNSKGWVTVLCEEHWKE